MLNVLTGEVDPHDPSYYATVQVPHRWNPEAQCPRWLKWLEQMQPSNEVREQIEEIFGYCMVPTVNFHKFFMFFGEGGTGKSTCVSVLAHLLGSDNTVSVRLEELDQPFMRHALVGRQLYLCKELTHQSFRHVGLIKAITSGDQINVDVKYGDGFSFSPTGRFVMESNVVAMTPDGSEGFGRRFLQVDWLNKVDAADMDYELEKIFFEEAEGIFVWAIQGFQRLYERGRFIHTEASQRAYKELMQHRNQVGMFLKDTGWVKDHWSDQLQQDGITYAELTEDNEATRLIVSTLKTACEHGNRQWYVSAGELYIHFLGWCRDNSVVPFIKMKSGGDSEKNLQDAAAFLMREIWSKNRVWKETRYYRRRVGGVLEGGVGSRKVRLLYGVELLQDTSELRESEGLPVATED